MSIKDVVWASWVFLLTGPFHLEQLLLTSWSLPWQLCYPSSFHYWWVSHWPKISLMPVTQHTECEAWCKKQNEAFCKATSIGVHPSASHLCYLTPGSPESSHKSYCSYSAEDYTNQHLFLAYFIGHCFIIPYKLVTTYPLGCYWQRTVFIIRCRTGTKWRRSWVRARCRKYFSLL